MKYALSVVPKSTPNADAAILIIEDPRPELLRPLTWLRIEELFAKYVPKNHFLVKMERFSPTDIPHNEIHA